MSDNRLMYGGDYYPEQWLDRPDLLRTDIERILEAKINTVTLGVFAWAKLEPREGEFTFDWLIKIMDNLWENGISVILATPSGARPHWLADKYPEVLRMTAKRERNLFGRRHNHCLTSPAYREKVRIINTELAKRCGSHPAVKMWHISNEYGGDCHCPLCQEAFRDWLRDRYGTIENLNDKWCTTFWSHTYDDFSQVESPSELGENSIMALELDWKRFTSDQTIDFMKDEIRALRDAGSDKPTTANLMYHFNGIDYFKLAKEIDIVSWDSYPVWGKHSDYEIARDNGFWHDVIKSLKRKPFLLLESCPGATNWQGVSKLKKPGVVEAAALQTIAHGGDGSLYFQMRQSRGAEEKFHGAVIDHYGGSDSRTFREVCKAGEMLEQIAAVAGSSIPAQAAVIYDWENRWAIQGSCGPRSDNMYHEECIEKSYYALRRQGLNVDVIDQSIPLDGYRFVAVPMQYLFHEGFAQKLRNYVADGGILVMTYWSGVVDENDRCFLGQTPYDMTDVLGLRREEIDGLYDWESNHICKIGAGEGITQPDPSDARILSGMRGEYECRNLCELVKPMGAETLMVYDSDFYAGRPALLKNVYGKGRVYYICADAEQAFYDDLYRGLTELAGVRGPLPGGVPEGVEVTLREDGRDRYLFLQNYGDKPVEIELPKGEILYGSPESLAPLSGIVIRMSKK